MPTLPSPASPPPALVEPDEEDLHTVPFPQPCPLWLSDTPPPLLGTLPPEDNILSTSPPELETRAGRENFVASLPAAVKGPLNKPYGKPHRNISFVGETCFRHVIPHLVTSGFMDHNSTTKLTILSRPVWHFRNLLREYMHLDTAAIRGYTLYKDSASETTLNTQRIRLSSAALLQQGCNMEKLVRHIAGPHLATHRNVSRILAKLTPSCTPKHLAELKRTFTHGAPKYTNASNTEANLLKYYHYGNHSSVDQNPDVFQKVLVKDSRRGHVIILDDRLFQFIPNTHLTPQGLVDIDNPWKKPRAIFDSTFRPDEFSMAINDWTTKTTEPDVTYPGSFVRFLQWLWNLRITYPTQPIYLGDDDVTGAFRLIKLNPGVVGMHMYRFNGHLIAATGQTFGDSFSPANFEPAAICRQSHARWLWVHRKNDILQRANSHVQKLEFRVDPTDSRPFSQANKDKHNPGVLDAHHNRLPPTYPMQVDDCLYADVQEHFPRTAAASVVALEDVFDGHHPYQDAPLSLEKLDPIHTEQRVLLGHYPDTRSMMVRLSPRRLAKITAFLECEGWLLPNHQATLRSIATVTGLLDSASEYFPWGRAQLLVIYGLLRNTIIHFSHRTTRQSRLRDKLKYTTRRMPKDMAYRLRFLKEKYVAQAMWNVKTPIAIPEDVRRSLVTIYKYMKTNQPWEQPIGHIVERTPWSTSTSDASTKAIGVSIPAIRAWCLLPYSAELCSRIEAKKVHINSLEFIGLLLAYIMVLERYNADPSQFPPHPILRALGDNKAANAWWSKMSTASTAGRNLLKLYAEYQLLAPLCSVPKHIKGVDNVVADTISRPHELWHPHLTTIHNVPYSTLVQQVCRHYKGKRRWDLFLVSAELASLLSSLLSSDLITERPRKPKTSGQFVPAASISSSGFQPEACSRFSFL